MAQHAYHNSGSGYMGTTSNTPTPFVGTTDKHKGVGKGKDIRTRNHCFAIGDCKVTRADGTTFTIASTRSHATSKRRTRTAVVNANKVSEAVKYGAHISMDERRKLNGL
jgi:hypothetical protein